MALATFTVRQLLEGAITRLTPLETDARLSGAEQALVGELVTADNAALSILRADNTISPGQRAARAQQIEDKAHALATVEAAHEPQISIDAFYNALDMSVDAACAIRLGLGTVLSDLG